MARGHSKNRPTSSTPTPSGAHPTRHSLRHDLLRLEGQRGHLKFTIPAHEAIADSEEMLDDVNDTIYGDDDENQRARIVKAFGNPTLEVLQLVRSNPGDWDEVNYLDVDDSGLEAWCEGFTLAPALEPLLQAIEVAGGQWELIASS